MTTPNELAQLDVVSNGETFHLEGHLCSLSAFSHVPTHRDLPKDRTYFNSSEKVYLMFKTRKSYKIIFSVLSDVKSLVYELDALKALNSLAKMSLDMLKQGNPCIYDSIFSKEDDFNPKLHRSDRRHDKLIGLEINQEVVLMPLITSEEKLNVSDLPMD
ncbi:uncharacterized protein DC041_0003866 [Schistosoma bovis]|uniref:Uncharacterized protein n=1 Tax=Schistosoma bovis TaxID=6184 RepID=A0A430QDT3_SCHBO|nr:uncharacterized protein DC041_0003866 [Schistosoma bovis]